MHQMCWFPWSPSRLHISQQDPGTFPTANSVLRGHGSATTKAGLTTIILRTYPGRGAAVGPLPWDVPCCFLCDVSKSIRGSRGKPQRRPLHWRFCEGGFVQVAFLSDFAFGLHKMTKLHKHSLQTRLSLRCPWCMCCIFGASEEGGVMRGGGRNLSHWGCARLLRKILVKVSEFILNSTSSSHTKNARLTIAAGARTTPIIRQRNFRPRTNLSYETWWWASKLVFAQKLAKSFSSEWQEHPKRLNTKPTSNNWKTRPNQQHSYTWSKHEN